jgi:predicted GIY-YIG superfamily endonuclease
MEEEALYSFYKVTDPRNKLPFYIGQTLDFERRQKDYLTGKGHSRPLDSRLKELELAGLQPIVEEIERKSCTQSAALEREAYWIQHFTDQGIVLLNRSNNKTRHKQQTVYLPPSLIKWLRIQAVQEDREISEIVAEALGFYRLSHRRSDEI